MADNKSKRGKADRSKVAGGEKYEVAYAAKKAGVKPAAVKKAIKKVGNSRKAVEKALKLLRYLLRATSAGQKNTDEDPEQQAGTAKDGGLDEAS